MALKLICVHIVIPMLNQVLSLHKFNLSNLTFISTIIYLRHTSYHLMEHNQGKWPKLLNQTGPPSEAYTSTNKYISIYSKKRSKHYALVCSHVVLNDVINTLAGKTHEVPPVKVWMIWERVSQSAVNTLYMQLL